MIFETVAGKTKYKSNLMTVLNIAEKQCHITKLYFLPAIMFAIKKFPLPWN